MEETLVVEGFGRGGRVATFLFQAGDRFLSSVLGH